MARRYAGHRTSAIAGAKPRRSTEWISGTVDWTDSTAGQSQILLAFSQAALADFVPCTIVRTVGILGVAADLNFITNQLFIGACGGCLVREDARIAAATPDAFTNAGDDVWFWHQFFAMQIDDRGDVDIKNSEIYSIDSRAQRKVVDGDAIIFNLNGGSSSDGFDATLMVRLLLKLH